MKVFLVLDETPFYHPNFIARFLEKTKDEIVGVGIVRKIPKRSNLELYLATHFYFLKVNEILKLLYKRCLYFLKDHFVKKKREGDFYSTESVIKFFNLSYFYIKYSINKEEYLDKIRKTQPDVIVSSNTLIFGKDILRIPRACCINIHSALLPAYGGLWPVLQAYRNKEEYVGVSVHVMKRRIDQGMVLSQIKIKIEDGDTIATLYEKCFEKSADVMFVALEKIAKSDISPLTNDFKPSYYSFPTKKHWTEFRKMGGRFI
jgi:methionyl-tRNA formyltransferase